ncbi:MAG TPA: hypothetical protein EYN92_06360 [Dehalococcoidia bacterium]|nr:hypothetical protein [Dehalococcoidia bacterium]
MAKCESCGKEGASKVIYGEDAGGHVYDEGAYEPNIVKREQMLCADCDEKRETDLWRKRCRDLFIVLFLFLILFVLAFFS